jgi:hypothetical protein
MSWMTCSGMLPPPWTNVTRSPTLIVTCRGDIEPSVSSIVAFAGSCSGPGAGRERSTTLATLLPGTRATERATNARIRAARSHLTRSGLVGNGTRSWMS